MLTTDLRESEQLPFTRRDLMELWLQAASGSRFTPPDI
jgi:hypothetical protein